MKLLKDILYKTSILEVKGSTNLAIANVCFDSRKADKDCVFVAVRGTKSDGHHYLEQVIEKGAIAIVCEEFPEEQIDTITYVRVKSSSASLGIIASNFYDNPSEKLKLVGITGTNGKTTIATLLYHLFRSLGKSVGLLSTIRNQINKEVIEATHTTPDPLQLNAIMARMVERGCSHCFMEVSSHALAQNRVSGLHFTGGIFTNITHDHLDYHKTFDEYLAAKKKFFDQLPEEAFALTNLDDPNGMVMVQNTKARVKTFSLKALADYKGRVIENQFTGLLLNIDGSEMWTKLIGSFNASNLLAVYACALLLNEEKLNILTSLSTINPIEGRFQHLRSESGIIGIVDYAHTPDALLNVLKTIKDIRTGNEKVITIVGCGGDRDKSKRPEMAAIACGLSDQVILTSDNPRSESPEAIIEDMKKGVESPHTKKVLAITDRKEAIKVACSMATNGDIILVAGKGHEKYQEIKGVKHEFDDLQVLNESLQTLEK